MPQINTSDMLNSGSVIPFDQTEVEAIMKKILYSNGVSDVMYAGSNISQLTSVVSYVIGSLNINTAINLQETILPLATKRMNILFGARQLGYEPHAKKGYKYNLKLTASYNTQMVDDEGDVDYSNMIPRAVILKQNTVFISGTKTYYYKGPTVNLFNFSNHDIQYKNDTSINPEGTDKFYKVIEVTEGTMISWEKDETLSWIIRDYPDEDGIQRPKQDYIIPFHDVEDDGIQIFVDTVDYSKAPENGAREYITTTKTKSNTFLIDDSFSQDKDKFVRMENIILQYPSVFFEYSGFGTPLLTDDLVRCNIFQTRGKYGEADGKFSVGDDVLTGMNSNEGNTGFEVIEYKLTRTGTSEESNSSIKENATVFNNTANRAVTKLDYITITKSDARVKEAEAWGGEDEIYPDNPDDPSNPGNPTPFDDTLPIGPGNYPYSGGRMKGHIWISTTPYSNKDFEYTPGIPAIMSKPGNPTAVPPIPNIAGSQSVPEKYELIIGTTGDGYNNLWNWYQSPENLYGFIDIQNPDNNVTGIIEDLNYYKIMTMELHHRNPLYVNFDFVCDVVKYDMTKTREDVNEKVMLTISKYFDDQLEVFEADYLNSNLQRVIDTTLTENSGIGYKVSAKGVLYKNMIDEVQKTIKCTLAYPYESMFDEVTGIINTDLLPKIDTNDFGLGNKLLSVNYQEAGVNFGEFDISTLQPLSLDIMYDGSSVGTYTLNNIGSIELEFNFDSVQDEVFGVASGEYVEFDIVYPFTHERNLNMPFSKNTIPRLRKVEFIYN